MTKTPEEKLNRPKPNIAIIGHGSLGTSVVKRNFTSEDEIEFVSAQNISDLYRASLVVIEEQKQEVKELRGALKELTDQIYKCPLDLSSDEKVEEATCLDAIIKQAKQLLKE